VPDIAIMSSGMDPEKHSIDPEVDKNIPDPLADAIRDGVIDKKILQHSHDADEAMKAFQEAQGQVIEIDAATNKRLLRRIDWNLMPVWTSYSMSLA
jgi:ACS family allantoate permease-like MFS transporter